MVARQQQMGNAGRVVMEGRDIGSAVFPQADIKVYLDASPEARGLRRLSEAPPGVSLEKVIEEIRLRDERDISRSHSPLVRVPGAVYLDSTGMSVDEVVEKIQSLISC